MPAFYLPFVTKVAKEAFMHRVTITIEGAIEVSETRELNDSEALPLFVKLKTILQGEEAPKRGGKAPHPQPSEPDSIGDAPPPTDESV